MDDCIFCKIVEGSSPSYKIWENNDFLAILNIFPNTLGASLVIPKKHYSSYFAEVPKDVLDGLMSASREVAMLLDAKFEDVGRTGLIFEGFGVDHLHSKLYPMHGTTLDNWEMIESNMDKYFDKYEGYISSHSSKRADDKDLEETAKLIRG